MNIIIFLVSIVIAAAAIIVAVHQPIIVGAIAGVVCIDRPTSLLG